MTVYYTEDLTAGTAYEPDWLGQNMSGAIAYADDSLFVVGVDTGPVIAGLPRINGVFANPFDRGSIQ